MSADWTPERIAQAEARVAAGRALLEAGWPLRRIALALDMERSLAEAERIWVQAGKELPA